MARASAGEVARKRVATKVESRSRIEREVDTGSGNGRVLFKNESKDIAYVLRLPYKVTDYLYTMPGASCSIIKHHTVDRHP